MDLRIARQLLELLKKYKIKQQSLHATFHSVSYKGVSRFVQPNRIGQPKHQELCDKRQGIDHRKSE